MHGIIFASLHDYARERLGSDAAQEVFEGRFYSMSAAHPDDEFARLLERTGHRLGLDVETLLYDFGAFTAESTFAHLYPAFYVIAGDTRSFLLSVEIRIHELVRATVPDAAPPALTARPLGDGGVEIEYVSPRRLCRLLEGLVAGTGRYYGEQIEIAQLECMLQGAAACRFRVTPARA
jgi:hypothetical protein